MRWIALTLSAGLLFAQRAEPPYAPSDAEKQQIRTKMGAIHSTDPDVEVYRKAGEWILRHPEEFYTKAYFDNTLAVLDIGITRQQQIAKDEKPWTKEKGRINRAYRSRIDGSVQPYTLTIPASYDPSKPVRLDVVLHGRAATMNEVSFLAPKKATFTGDYIQLEVYGRTNNAYRWGGETDVFEAIESVRSQYKIDPNQIVLRGFSMGGAGAWHIGLHYPDRWAAIEAGAGFTETIRYAKINDAPAYQLSTMHIYDAVDYALNAFNVPMIGYGGEIDPQLQASENIKTQLHAEGLTPADLRVHFLIGPQTAHKFHPDSKKESDRIIDSALDRGRQVPEHIRFVTYSTRYNECFWLKVDELEKHYTRTDVDAKKTGKGITIQTKNVARLSLTSPSAVLIDGQQLPSGSAFEKKDGKWKAARHGKALRKHHGLQGPIDDAFMDSFLCVKPPAGFAREYAKWMRADLRVKDAGAVTREDIAGNNLVLFGDPKSNKLIAKIAGKLPIRWSKGNIVAGDKQFSAADHTLTLIYPNPLNPNKYVVLNSGYTFGDAEFKGTNALLYPRMGDYAIIRRSDNKVVFAGLFDDNWKLPASRQ
jgi:dienelactone hydrolase